MIRRREGFTLVELLVVVAIIIILAAVLFPIFAKAREKAQHTRCLNNLKQIASAIEMYEDDYDGAILPQRVTGAGGTESSTNYATYEGFLWNQLVEPYLKVNKGKAKVGSTSSGVKVSEIWICPSAPLEDLDENAAFWQSSGMKTYGYNPYLSVGVTTSQVKFPSVTLRTTETADYIGDPHNPERNYPPGSPAKYKGGSMYCPIPVPSVKGYTLNLVAPGWHSGYNDVLWVDGHVSSITWERVMYTDTCNNTTTDPNVWCRLEPKEGYTAE